MNVSTDVHAPASHHAVTHSDAVVVGAGPYGLSAAAHLQKYGMKVAIFGKPLDLWRQNMPDGMLLRSHWWATNLSDPYRQYGMSTYFAEQGQTAPTILSRETFIDYALWFQQHAVPHIDETYIATIERMNDQFYVTLVDDRVVRSRVVVMAPGLSYYTYRPTEYNHLSPSLTSHTADHATFDRFAGKRVLILGGGQSALESAALLHESGAIVEVISRHAIRWLVEDQLENRSLWLRLRHPMAGIAPGWFNWGLEHFPYVFQRLPRTTKDTLLRGKGSYGPAGSHWLKPRLLGKVPIHEGRTVQQAREENNSVVLTLSDGQTLQGDHLLLATGYRVDVQKLPMLHPSLVDCIQTYQGAPILTHQFESSVPGLYFIGISSLSSCGPLYRFVVGTASAARQVARSISYRVRREPLPRIARLALQQSHPLE
jgi:cation diffusion facilitator CzcD-associated flavoprotein CzcO